jgi:arsenate reductase
MTEATWQAEAVELQRLAPKHLLFLCVANSARSQMAEGIARALAPAGVTLSSAGSRPSQVNPLAIRALDELGLDLRGHQAKSVETISPDGVEAVITLCAEEECPVFLGQARRFHWGLPDPAGHGATETARLQAFRDVRDELRRRLSAVFPAATAAAAARYGYRPGTPADVPAIRALLTSLGLPAQDVGGPAQSFLVVCEGEALAGCVGLERCGEDALLRSLAVVPRLQGAGLGRALRAQAVEAARAQGLRTLYLLTTTAAPFFERAGFARVDRAAAPAPIAASPEFSALCPASAVCMRLALA